MPRGRKKPRPTVGNRWPQAIERAGGLELRFDDRGEFDELVVSGASMHIERMGDGHWWLSVRRGEHSVQVNLNVVGPRLVHPIAEWTCRCFKSHEAVK